MLQAPGASPGQFYFTPCCERTKKPTAEAQSTLRFCGKDFSKASGPRLHVLPYLELVGKGIRLVAF